MNHAPPEEIHDHAYGFRKSGHVASCPDCRAAADAVEAERRAIARALREETPEAPAGLLAGVALRPRGARLPLLGLAAAAALLAGLAWLLFRAPGPNGDLAPADAGRQAPHDAIDRLIGELRSPSALRREVAAHALKGFGDAAAERLEKGKADPALVDACRGITPEARRAMKTLEEKRIDLAFENTKIEDILVYIRDSIGLNILVDAEDGPLDHNRVLTLQARGITVAEALRRILAPLSDPPLRFRVTDAAVVLLTSKDRPAAEARAPVRVRSDGAAVRRWTEALATGERGRAALELRRLGFAAEPELWKALDLPNAEGRALAASLLRRLYDPNPDPPGDPLREKLGSIRVTLDLENASFADFAASLSAVSEIPLVFDTRAVPKPEEEMLSIKLQNIVMDGALRLALGPRGQGFVVVDDAVVITGADRTLRAPDSPFWTAPEEAKKLEALVEGLLSSSADRRASAERELLERGVPALGPLREAELAFPGSLAARCRAVRRRIAQEKGAWLVDDRSGADLQPLAPAQHALLERKLGDVPADATIRGALGGLGVAADLRAGGDVRSRFSGKELRLGTFLRGTLRPHGLDFYLEGQTVVVDTAERVRAAVEK
jgi:hypothetical protein